MCDYSLENVNSRPARVADRLVTTTFTNTITRGFAATDDVNMAVCLLPGTELAFERDVEYDHPVTHQRTSVGGSTARFRELDRYNVFAHHDALEFPNGMVIPLTRLVCGQKAVVLQLPARLVEAPAQEETAVPEVTVVPTIVPEPTPAAAPVTANEIVEPNRAA
jgi:hypothetical protein